MKPFIVIGDRTSHGGTVIEGSMETDAAGKPIARIGDKVTCPKHGRNGIVMIATGDATCVIDGQPAARDGDETDCGAILIAGQMPSTD